MRVTENPKSACSAICSQDLSCDFQFGAKNDFISFMSEMGKRISNPNIHVIYNFYLIFEMALHLFSVVAWVGHRLVRIYFTTAFFAHYLH